MKKHLLIILIAFYLIGSSLYAKKTFFKKDHIHSHIDRCNLHEHHHNGSAHQHKHSNSQTTMSFIDFFTGTKNINLLESQNLKQTYLETVFWIPNPSLESLFRPPII